MAKGVGLDIGEYEIKVVELDGSYKKPRLAKVSIDGVEVAADDDAEASRASGTLHILKDAGIARDNVCLAFPCREAVLRTITVPFVGEENIRKVVKFEVEGNIHSHNVDDMVVDFLTLEASANHTKVLVIAAPKAPLRARLKALDGVGIEPEAVDLDATALFRTADWLGCFAPSDADKVKAELAPAGAGPGAHLVIDVGARSSAMLVVVDGKLIDMRTLRTGTDAIVDDLATGSGVPLAKLRAAVIASLQSGRDQPLEQAEAPPAEAAEAAKDKDVAALARTEVLSHAKVAAARDRFVERLQRELQRFLAAVPQIRRVEAVWYTGGGTQLPGVVDVLRRVFETEPRLLDVLGRMQHGLQEEEAADVNPRIATAVGLALGMMGGPSPLNFRREDLVFARRFDRIKFPLAVVCMLGVFLLFFLGLQSYTRYRGLALQYGSMSFVTTDRKAKLTFHGYDSSFLRKVMTGPGGVQGLLTDVKAYEALCADLAKAPPFTELERVRKALEKHKRTQEESTGYYEDLSLESGYAVLVRMAEVLGRLKDALGRYLITDIHLALPPQTDGRSLKMTFALSEDFRGKHAAIKAAFAEDARQPESPFLRVDDGSQADIKLFLQSEDGAFVTVKVMVKPRFEVFQGAPTR